MPERGKLIEQLAKKHEAMQPICTGDQDCSHVCGLVGFGRELAERLIAEAYTAQGLGIGVAEHLRTLCGLGKKL